MDMERTCNVPLVTRGIVLRQTPLISIKQPEVNFMQMRNGQHETPSLKTWCFNTRMHHIPSLRRCLLLHVFVGVGVHMCVSQWSEWRSKPLPQLHRVEFSAHWNFLNCPWLSGRSRTAAPPWDRIKTDRNWNEEECQVQKGKDGNSVFHVRGTQARELDF